MLGSAFGQTPREHVECPTPPGDTPSDLSWYWRPETHALLAAASWDGTVRIWEVQTQLPLQNQPFPDSTANTQHANSFPKPQTKPDGATPTITQIVPRALFQNAAPVLSCHFYTDHVFTGTADKKVMMYNITSQQNQQVGQHDSGVCKVFFNSKKNLVCSIGWDSCINWWDTRSPQPAGQFKVPGNVWESDMTNDVIAALSLGEARRIYVYDVNDMNHAPLTLETSALYYPPRKIRIFPNNQGLVISGTEGRCRIVHFTPDKTKDDFNFRCHRLGPNNTVVLGTSAPASSIKCYAVNGVDFNPIYGTLLSAVRMLGHVLLLLRAATVIFAHGISK